MSQAAIKAPLIVGIAGGTGSGKTTLAKALGAALPPGCVTVLDHDAYYRDRSGMPPAERDALNFDHPDALETALLAEHLSALKSGRSVEIPIYDFASHTRRKEARAVSPTPVIVLEGILVFVEPALRDVLDIKIFVDTPDDVRLLRRIRRDIEERGRTLASVARQYQDSVRPMHQEFVVPSKRHADLVVPEGGDWDVALSVIVARLRHAVV